MRFVAPAGAPIRAADLARWIRTLPARDVAGRIGEALRRKFEVRHCAFTRTGRAGLTVVLRALRTLASPERNEVILPAYTCYSVAASVVKAGLRPRLVDINLCTLDYATDALQSTPFDHVLAIVATNLYGLPSNLPAWSQLAAERGVFLVDDAAQSMGARVGEKWSGTWGDAGLFSLDKGKPVTAIDGGIVVTNSDAVMKALQAELSRLEAGTRRDCAFDVAKALVYSVFLRPSLYWIPQSVPQLGLGRTEYTTQFRLGLPDPAMLGLWLAAIDHLDDYVRIRLANARGLIRGLQHMPGLSFINPLPGSEPGYLRLPVLMTNTAMKDEAIGALTDAGIGATASYPGALADVAGLRDAIVPGAGITAARAVAARIMTLPTHPFVSPRDRNRIVETLMPIVSRPAV